MNYDVEEIYNEMLGCMLSYYGSPSERYMKAKKEVLARYKRIIEDNRTDLIREVRK